MLRRHPHVFGDVEIASVAAQNEAWEAHKAAEREATANARSVVDGVALALPALLRAAKISGRAARIGFDWPDGRAVIPKIAEEIAEVEAELDAGGARAALEEEIGDLLFAVANLARKLEVEPETALRRATAKFERRFRQVRRWPPNAPSATTSTRWRHCGWKLRKKKNNPPQRRWGTEKNNTLSPRRS